ncbi:MAG: hypothetical protein WC499_04835, partial [Patescibacteria group bacterium]
MTTTTAVIGGNITASTTNINKYGTQYGTTGSYGSWINSTVTKAAPFTFTNTTPSLTQGTGYYFRAFAINNDGVGYGSQSTFLTLPVKPNYLTATTYNSTAVMLSWEVGAGADYTVVRYNTGTTYPNTTADGTLACNVTAGTNSYILSGLTVGNTYYFSGWSWTSDSGGTGLTAYSSDYSTCTGTSSSTYTFDAKISTGSDDATVSFNGAAWGIDTTRIVNDIGYYSSTYQRMGSGYRFSSVTIPSGATITYANITFRSYGAYSGATCYSYILGDLEADPATWTTLANYQGRRGTAVGGANNNYHTVSNVTWTVPAFSSGVDYATPDITSVVQELVNQAGWTSGNHMAFWVDDHNARSSVSAYRFMNSYETSATTCARLHIEYTIPIPTVITAAATNLNTTNVTIGGTVAAIGSSNVTQWGSQYGMSTSYGSWANNTGTVTGYYSWSDNITSLTQGKGYYFRAFAKNTQGYGYGTQKALLTPPEPPTAFTLTSYNTTAIQMNWTVGTGYSYTPFWYRTDTYPSAVGDGTLACNTTTNNYMLTGLDNTLTYYFRGWSWTGNDTVGLTAYSSTYVSANGTAVGLVPTINTTAATNIESTHADIGGNITASTFPVSKYGTQYGMSTSYGSWINSTTFQSAPFTFSNTTTALTQAKGYYFRAFATNSVGDGFGSQLTYLTPPDVPAAFSATAYNTTAIALNWTKGTGAYTTPIWYRTDTYPSAVGDGTLADNSTGTSVMVTGLDNTQTYFFRAWSWTSNSTVGLTAYSTTSLTDSEVPVGGAPTLTTSDASAISSTGATYAGNVLTSTTNVTTYGFQYGLSTSYGSWINSTVYQEAPFSFSNTTASLTQGKGYYFRAFAVNSWGTGYGSQKTHLTMPDAPITFTATAFNTTAIELAWTKGAGALYTPVWYSNTSYPVNVGDGTLACNNTATSAIIAGLDNTQTYFFTAWGWTSNSTVSLTSYSNTSMQAFASPTGTAPVVTTSAASAITSTGATLNGSVTSSTTNVTQFGFQYGQGSTYGFVINSTVYREAPFSFNNTTVALNQGQGYYFRAFVGNTLGIGYGGQLTYLTPPDAPTGFTASSYNATAIQLSWFSGTGRSTTPIWYKDTGYPATTGDGTLAYNSTATSTIISGLDYTKTYYFTAWSWTSNSTVGLNAYSNTSVQASSMPLSIVRTLSCTGFTSSTAVLNGQVLSTPDAIDSYGFDYGIDTGYGGSVIIAGVLTSNDYFWLNAINLNAGSVYHFRAKVHTALGWAYGQDSLFATKGSPVRWEYWNTGLDTNSAPTYYANMTSMQFTANTTSHTVTSIRIPLVRVGTAATNTTVQVGLYHADAANKPTGTVLAYGTMDGSYISTSSYAWYGFTLNQEVSIQAFQPYSIVLQYQGDSSNYIMWGIDTGG